MRIRWSKCHIQNLKFSLKFIEWKISNGFISNASCTFGLRKLLFDTILSSSIIVLNSNRSYYILEYNSF